MNLINSIARLSCPKQFSLTLCMDTSTIHHGRNVKRIREILGVKQDALASSLGLSQQAISQLEQKEVLDETTIQKVSKILGVSEDAIKNFSDEKAINIISNTYHDQSALILYNFNPVNKWVEAIEDNRKLYERLIQAEQEKNELLQRLLNAKGWDLDLIYWLTAPSTWNRISSKSTVYRFPVSTSSTSP